jgi:uncharacterized damage-inducible protein DinB
MLQQYFAQQYEAALLQLKNEINSYTHKDHVWELKGQILNSGGTLALHLTGNLNHFIGAVLGNTGYVRQRDKEFSERNVPTGKLIKEIDELTYRVKNIISNLTDEQLFGEYPLKDGKEERLGKTTIQRLIYFLAHLNYHLGQINYHRRLFDQPVSLPDEVEKLDQPNTLAHSAR